jgi:hypothetical protein
MKTHEGNYGAMAIDEYHWRPIVFEGEVRRKHGTGVQKTEGWEQR